MEVAEMQVEWTRDLGKQSMPAVFWAIMTTCKESAVNSQRTPKSATHCIQAAKERQRELGPLSCHEFFFGRHHKHTTHTPIKQPFVWDYPGELAPER